jgi:ornithine racemase
MADLIVRPKKILGNIKKINDFLDEYNIYWTLILKVLSGHKGVLEKILNDEQIKRLHSIGDSRLSNLKIIKKIRPDLVTMYIKPPSVDLASSIVRYCDISFNTSYETINALNNEAKKLGIIHKIIIMIELGELREGILRENIVDFYKKVFNLENVDIIGIGSNLGCMYGVEPTYDKLIQLSLYKRIIEATFNQKLSLVSGGSSITLPLVSRKKIPKLINHFRIGEAAFLGLTPMTGKKFNNLSIDAFEYRANILELEKKENIPDGNISSGNVGFGVSIDEKDSLKKSYKAVVDYGVLDADTKELEPKDKKVKFVGTTSDMTVYEIDTNQSGKTNPKYHVGGHISFKPTYMGVARLMHSKFVEKKIL